MKIDVTRTTNTAGAAETTEATRTTTKSTPSTPIDRSNEKLIDNATTFNALLRILASNPEVLANAEAEAQEREAEEKEARLRKTYGDDYDLVFDKKKANEKLSIMTGKSTDKNTVNKSTDTKSRRPGAIQLRTYVPRVAMIKIGENGICEVFNNGYAVYDNGDRKTVIWVPDCGTAKYYFVTGTDEITKDEMGEFPWFNAVLIAGEDSIQYNMEHPKTQASTSDSDIDDVKPAASWAGATRFPNPEEAYLRKEAAEERKKALTEKQRKTYEMYYEQGDTIQEIAREQNICIGTVQERLGYIRKKLIDNKENFFL